MSITYVVSDNGKLTKSGDVLHMISDNCTTTIYPHRIDQLVILGRTEITSYALKLLMLHNVDTIFMSSSGRFNGKLVFQSGKNVLLRKRQYDLLNDKDFCLNFAKSVVASKLKSQMTFLQRSSRVHGSDMKTDINQIREYINAADRCQDMAALRGYEGIGARHYFNSFKHTIIPDWAVFNGRNMFPPKDNVNAVLSFLYTIIMFRVDAALESADLDPYCGYYHTLGYGRKSLAFDLMEEYRVVLGDTVTAALFNTGILSPDDFHNKDFSSTNDEYPLESKEDDGDVENKSSGVLLTKEGLKKVISKFEQKLDTEILHPNSGKRIKYRNIFFEQVRHFKHFLMGEDLSYKPFEAK
jgi:CRISPR-associated protein Cas1